MWLYDSRYRLFLTRTPFPGLGNQNNRCHYWDYNHFPYAARTVVRTSHRSRPCLETHREYSSFRYTPGIFRTSRRRFRFQGRNPCNDPSRSIRLMDSRFCFCHIYGRFPQCRNNTDEFWCRSIGRCSRSHIVTCRSRSRSSNIYFFGCSFVVLGSSPTLYFLPVTLSSIK